MFKLHPRRLLVGAGKVPDSLRLLNNNPLILVVAIHVSGIEPLIWLWESEKYLRFLVDTRSQKGMVPVHNPSQTRSHTLIRHTRKEIFLDQKGFQAGTLDETIRWYGTRDCHFTEDQMCQVRPPSRDVHVERHVLVLVDEKVLHFCQGDKGDRNRALQLVDPEVECGKCRAGADF